MLLEELLFSQQIINKLEVLNLLSMRLKVAYDCSQADTKIMLHVFQPLMLLLAFGVQAQN